MELACSMNQDPNGYNYHINGMNLTTNEPSSSSLNGSNTSSFSSNVSHGVVNRYPSGQVRLAYHDDVQSCPTQSHPHSCHNVCDSPNKSMNSTTTRAVVHDHVHNQASNCNLNVSSFHSEHEVTDNKSMSSLVPTIGNAVRHVQVINHDNPSHNGFYYGSLSRQKEQNERNHEMNPREITTTTVPTLNENLIDRDLILNNEHYDNEKFELRMHTTPV
jgi:hypothetical protein